MQRFAAVADGQRLGLKLKLGCERPLASSVRLARSRAVNGDRPVRGGAGWLWNDKGASRMNVGLRVLRGGVVDALIMIAMPVAATVSAALVSSPAAGQIHS